MKTINRTVVFVSPKQPFIDWANSMDDDPELLAEETFATAYLIPDRYGEVNYEQYIKENSRRIFEIELASWVADEESWPPDRSYDAFQKWFDIRVADSVFDLCQIPLIRENF